MKKILLLLFISQLIYCQSAVEMGNQGDKDYPTFYHLMRAAKDLAAKERIPQAIAKFEEATKLVPYTPTENWIWATENALKIENCELAIAFYTQALQQQFDGTFNQAKLEQCSKWGIAQVELKELATNSELNLTAKRLIDSMFLVDQNVRAVHSPEMAIVDSTNFLLLQQLIKKYGFPSEQLVGQKSAGHAFIILLHMDRDVGNKTFGSILEKAFYDGQINPESYAWIIDRRRNWRTENRLAPYYYQMPTPDLFSLSDEERAEINKRRYEIGLKPLEELNAKMGTDGTMTITL